MSALAKFTSSNDIDVQRATLTRGDVKELCCMFYYHWHNIAGTNTEQGFTEWFNNQTNSSKITELDLSNRI